MSKIQSLINAVASARKEYLDQIESLTETAARWKPNDEKWNVIDITEHLYWAEQGAICGMWKTLLAIREGKLAKEFESVHKNMPIEQVVELTWQTKEKVPAVASPRFGGSLDFWKLSLQNLQNLLEAFAQELKEEDLRVQGHPHPISGPLDFQQRIEFLRFHINRHKDQVTEVMKSMNS